MKRLEKILWIISMSLLIIIISSFYLNVSAQSYYRDRMQKASKQMTRLMPTKMNRIYSRKIYYRYNPAINPKRKR